MVPAPAPKGLTPELAKAIRTVAGMALDFGIESANALEHPEALEDAVTETYFLIYVFGAVDAFSDHLDPDHPLELAPRLDAMAEALRMHGGGTEEHVVATVKMLMKAQDEPARRMRAEGYGAGRRWMGDERTGAAAHFAQLLTQPELFPREVDSVGPEGRAVQKH